MRKHQWFRALAAGGLGTGAMFALFALAHQLKLPTTDPLFSNLFKGGAIGLTAILFAGLLLGPLYAKLFYRHLPGGGWFRGMLFGLIPWCGIGITLPMFLGEELFGGNLLLSLATLPIYLASGAVLGAAYRESKG